MQIRLFTRKRRSSLVSYMCYFAISNEEFCVCSTFFVVNIFTHKSSVSLAAKPSLTITSLGYNGHTKGLVKCLVSDCINVG